MVIEDGLSIQTVSERLGMAEFNLRRWVHVLQKESQKQQEDSSDQVLSRLNNLEEENKQLKLERAILKKAMAYFVVPQS